MKALAAEQRRLAHAVAAASDDALARVVALFDRMADRQEADWLLDAARPRLRRLRLPRPITLTRLLFLPLDGAIVDPRTWKRQDGSLPRSALPALADAVLAAIGAEARAVDAMIAGRSFAEIRVVGEAGLRLWCAAAEARLSPPPAWASTGLTAADFAHCAGLAAGVWRHARPLWTALLVAREGPPAPLVQAVVTEAAQEPPMVIEAMVATLLLKAAKPGSVAAAAAAVRGAPPDAAERVLDRWLQGCAPDLSARDPRGAARLAEEFAEVIEDLAASPATRRPDRQKRVAELRHQVDEACRTTFAEASVKVLIEPLAHPAGRIDDAGMQALEAAARSLKRLELAGRQLGGGAAYDAALRRITDTLGALPRGPGASPADLARLTEILAGPEAALRLLGA